MVISGKRIVVSVLVFMVLAAVCPSVRAQRQTKGRTSLDASVMFCGLNPDKPFALSGGSVQWNSYLYSGYTAISIEAVQSPHKHITKEEAVYNPITGEMLYPEETFEDKFNVWDVLAGGGYYYRLLAPRSRVFILSVGILGYAGVRYSKYITQFYKTDKNGALTTEQYPSTNFLFQLVPDIRAEIFPFNNVSLYVSCRPKINVVDLYGGKGDLCNVYMACGLKYYL